jgi:hypothetical protein
MTLGNAETRSDNERGVGTGPTQDLNPFQHNAQAVYTASDLAHYYELGVAHERERAAAAGHEADISWRPDAAAAYSNAKAYRLRQFEECAHRFHERELGKPYVEFQGVAR